MFKLTPMTPASQELHVPETPTTSGTNLSLGQEACLLNYIFIKNYNYNEGSICHGHGNIFHGPLTLL